MTDIQKVIQAARTAFHRYKLQGAAKRVREREASERANAELELVLDDVKAEGIDPRSELGFAIVTMVLTERKAKAQREVDREVEQRLRRALDPNDLGNW